MLKNTPTRRTKVSPANPQTPTRAPRGQRHLKLLMTQILQLEHRIAELKTKQLTHSRSHDNIKYIPVPVDRTVEKELLREVEREVIKVVQVEQDDPIERVVERKLERPVETVVQKIMVRPAKPQEKTVEVPEQRELIREAIKPLDQKLKERLAGELKKKNLFEGELQANRLLISQLTDQLKKLRGMCT